MKRIDTDPYRVRPGKNVRLSKWPTRVKAPYKTADHYKELLANQINDLSELQSRHYAANRHALLVIFQAMDAAGKDGAIKHVMSGVNPQGVQVFSFKHPSAAELEHDFMWRTTLCLPERGHIGIFNRSYYEEVLIVRVHPQILRGEGLPPEVNGKGLWKRRFRSIVDFEKHLHRNGTHIIKFFLHISKNEQRRRFLDRIDDPEKNWKFNVGDLEERKVWKDYMSAYEDCLAETSTLNSPWFVIPADDKKTARLIVAQVIVDTLSALKPAYPAVTAARLRELKASRKLLVR
jgi:PPK2 family polyphosphate:nucleotide phosphotransferase